MAASLRRGGLVAFRLGEIMDRRPDLVTRAVNVAITRSRRALDDDDVRPEDRLFARLASMRRVEDEEDAIRRAAAAPSDRVYFVRREAWDRVMGA